MEKRYTKPEKYIGLGVWYWLKNGPVKRKIKELNVRYTENGWEPVSFVMEDGHFLDVNEAHNSKRAAVSAYREGLERKKQAILNKLHQCEDVIEEAKKVCSGSDRRRQVKEWLEHLNNTQRPAECPKFVRKKDYFWADLDSGMVIEACRLSDKNFDTWFVLWGKPTASGARSTVYDSCNLNDLYEAAQKGIPDDNL